jgi:hypothetical protein
MVVYLVVMLIVVAPLLQGGELYRVFPFRSILWIGFNALANETKILQLCPKTNSLIHHFNTGTAQFYKFLEGFTEKVTFNLFP